MFCFMLQKPAKILLPALRNTATKPGNVPPTDQEVSIHLYGCGTAVSAGGGGGTTVLLSRSLNAIKDGVNPDTVADISDHH